MGWLRAGRDHWTMAAIPSFREKDAKRASRDCESPLGEQSQLNRMKETLIRLGIPGFHPKLRHAELQLEALRPPRVSRPRPTLWSSSSGTSSAGGSSAEIDQTCRFYDGWLAVVYVGVGP